MLCCLRHLDISSGTVFVKLCCLHQLDISTETVLCNSLLLTPPWWYLDISTQTVFCNAMLLTPPWYIDSDCILQWYAAYVILISRLRLFFRQCYAAYAILISRLRLIFNAMLLTPSWYLDWDCILQYYAAYAILISWLRLSFAMLCCLRYLYILTNTVFAMLRCLHPR